MTRDIKNLEKDFIRAIDILNEEVTRILSEEIYEEALESLERPKSGKLNPSTGRNRSARGESPATDTGLTAASTNVVILKQGGTSSAIEIRNDTDYAERLEEDLDRPYLQNAIENVIEDGEYINKLIDINLESILNESR